MTLAEIQRRLALMKRTRDAHVTVYRVIVNPDKQEVRRLYRGSFIDKHRPVTGDSNDHVPLRHDD